MEIEKFLLATREALPPSFTFNRSELTAALAWAVAKNEVKKDRGRYSLACDTIPAVTCKATTTAPPQASPLNKQTLASEALSPATAATTTTTTTAAAGRVTHPSSAPAAPAAAPSKKVHDAVVDCLLPVSSGVAHNLEGPGPSADPPTCTPVATQIPAALPFAKASAQPRDAVPPSLQRDRQPPVAREIISSPTAQKVYVVLRSCDSIGAETGIVGVYTSVAAAKARARAELAAGLPAGFAYDDCVEEYWGPTSGMCFLRYGYGWELDAFGVSEHAVVQGTA